MINLKKYKDMNQELRKEIIDDYRNIVMSKNGSHLVITDDEIMELWFGVDMCKEMENIEEILQDVLEKKNQSFLSHYAKGDAMKNWVREAVWEKYGSMTKYECGCRFVFRKRKINEVKIVKILSDEDILTRFLDEAKDRCQYSEIGSNDEGIDYITLDDDVLGGVMCEVTKEGTISIRIVPDDTDTRQDYVVNAIDTFGLYEFCEKHRR